MPRRSEDAWRRQLARSSQETPARRSTLIEAGELELSADNTHDLGHVPVWHRGPMIIIGDAAHAPAPTSGQGASMAIEDAIALAGELGRAASIEAAFAAYERRRRERVEKIVAWGARGSSNKVPGRFGRVVRDVMLRILFRWVITEKSLGWMYDYRIGLGRATPRPRCARCPGRRSHRRNSRAGTLAETAQAGIVGEKLGRGSPPETIPERNSALMTPLAMSIKL